jgi:type III secretion protein K
MATVATDADFVATLMRGNRTLYSRLHEFNLLPTRSMHPSWRVALFPPSVQALLERSDLDARTHARLSAYLLEGPTVGARTFWEPSPGLALALLEPAALMELARRIGAAFASGKLRNLLTGGWAATARRSLGEGLHDFALQRAPLLMEPADLDSAAAQGLDPTEEGLSEVVATLGAGTLRSAWEPEGLWPRARLKLPRDLAEAAEQVPAAPPAACKRLALRIARENEPQWHTSFAPASA